MKNHKLLLTLILLLVIISLGVGSFVNHNAQSGTNLFVLAMGVYFFSFLLNSFALKPMSNVFYTPQAIMYIATMMVVILINFRLFYPEISIQNGLGIAALGFFFGAFAKWRIFEFIRKYIARVLEQKDI